MKMRVIFAVKNTTKAVVNKKANVMNMKPKKIQACTGLQPMTLATSMQFFTSSSSKPTKSWSFCCFLVKPCGDKWWMIFAVMSYLHSKSSQYLFFVCLFVCRLSVVDFVCKFLKFLDMSLFSFFPLVLMYIIIGVLINRYGRGVESMPELLPNHSFWADFPFLVKVKKYKLEHWVNLRYGTMVWLPQFHWLFFHHFFVSFFACNFIRIVMCNV